MSYTAATPGGKVRPATVTVAQYLLYACAGFQVINAVLTVLSLGPTVEAYREHFKNDPNGDAQIAGAQIGGFGGVAVAALFIVGAVLLAVFLGRGKNPARIVTWVLSGIGVLCFGCGLAFSGIASSMNTNPANDPDLEALTRKIEDAIPGWQAAVSTVIGVLVLLALIGVIVLLALPASNEFFRKEQEVWVPPTTPPYPEYPPVPLSVPAQTAPPAPEAMAPPAPVAADAPASVAPEPPVAPAPAAAPESPASAPATEPPATSSAPPADPTAPTPPSNPQS
jgi:MFS family permease